MSSASPPERFIDRLRIYKRREQLTVWVAGGAAGLIGAVAASVLQGKPALFTQLVVTCAILAGVAIAFARVNFEWLATLIRRQIADQVIQKTDPLPQDREHEDRFAEWCWSTGLWGITAGGAVLLLGVWWPAQQKKTEVKPPAPAAVASAGLEHLAAFAGFEPGHEALNPDQGNTRADLERICRTWKEHREAGRDGILLVVGSTDRLALRGTRKQRYETNVGLARARAEAVSRELLARAPDMRPSHLLVLVSGPRSTPDGRNGPEGYPDDRRVDVWAFWSLPAAAPPPPAPAPNTWPALTVAIGSLLLTLLLWLRARSRLRVLEASIESRREAARPPPSPAPPAAVAAPGDGLPPDVR